MNIKNEAPWALYGENTIAFADLEDLVKFLCGGKGKDREDGVWKSDKTLAKWPYPTVLRALRTFQASNLGDLQKAKEPLLR